MAYFYFVTFFTLFIAFQATTYSQYIYSLFFNDMMSSKYYLHIIQPLVSTYGNKVFFGFVLFFSCLFLLISIWQYFYRGTIESIYLKRYGTLSKIQAMDDGVFEEMIKDLFIAKGFSAKRIGGSGADGGVDVLINNGFVQCKRYKYGNNISVKIVREMIGVANLRGYKNIYIYTTSDFTQPAIKEAELFNKAGRGKISLVNGKEIIQEMKKYF